MTSGCAKPDSAVSIHAEPEALCPKSRGKRLFTAFVHPMQTVTNL